MFGQVADAKMKIRLTWLGAAGLLSSAESTMANRTGCGLVAGCESIINALEFQPPCQSSRRFLLRDYSRVLVTEAPISIGGNGPIVAACGQRPHRSRRHRHDLDLALRSRPPHRGPLAPAA